MQAQHDERRAKCNDRSVGLKLEPNMQLEEDSGPVQYQLAMVVFRIGEMESGHFYVAAPACNASLWVVYNEDRASKPVTLQQLRQMEEKNVHGVVYVRTQAPSTNEWCKLNATNTEEIPVRYIALKTVLRWISKKSQT